MRLLDTNVIIEVVGAADATTSEWSLQAYQDALRSGDVACNFVVFAELSASMDQSQALTDLLASLEIDLIELPLEGAFRAGRAFAEYRRRGGSRQAILADFLIAGHAASIGAPLVTRDRRLGSYFPDLTLITPETYP